MKLLRIIAEGLPLFKDKLDINFCAQQRVSEEQKRSLYPLFSHVFLNQCCGFIGLNASGKTSILKVILLAIDILNNKPINHISTKEILGDTKKAHLSIYFYSEFEHEISLLDITITFNNGRGDGLAYSIVSETLITKKASTECSRQNLFKFSSSANKTIRQGNEDFLPDDVSIMIARNKRTHETLTVENLLLYTNMNVLPISKSISPEIITFLDPTIESLYFSEQDQKILIHLKFKGREEILLNDPKELNNYLSSGTIKGINIFTLAKEVMSDGGYLVIDEIENHLNKEIVATLLRFFMNNKINKTGATLIFSTHYPELLDIFTRNDSIFITRNIEGFTAQNLNELLKRNDIKKSDAFQSDFLGGTSPKYQSYINLKRSFQM